MTCYYLGYRQALVQYVYCVCTLACSHLPPTCSSLVVNADGYVYVSVSPLDQNSPEICLMVLMMYAVISFSHSGVTLHEQWECMFSCLVLLVSLCPGNESGVSQ